MNKKAVHCILFLIVTFYSNCLKSRDNLNYDFYNVKALFYDTTVSNICLIMTPPNRVDQMNKYVYLHNGSIFNFKQNSWEIIVYGDTISGNRKKDLLEDSSVRL